MKTTLAKVTLAVFACALLLSAFTGCGAKTAQSADGFTQIMEDAGFDVADMTAELGTDEITSILFAVGTNYQMEYYAFNDSESCADCFYFNKEEFDEEFSVKSFSSEITLNTYNYYAFNADGDFHMIARVDNTLLICVADKAYKSEITDLLKTLGYK